MHFKQFIYYNSEDSTRIQHRIIRVSVLAFSVSIHLG